MTLDHFEDIEEIPTVRDIKGLIAALKGQAAGTSVKMAGFAETFALITKTLRDNGLIAKIESQSHIVSQKERDARHPRDIEYTFTVTLRQDSSS